VPENGANDEYVDYFTWEGHYFARPPGTEVPIDVVFEAVRECVDTMNRPTCVRGHRCPIRMPQRPSSSNRNTPVPPDKPERGRVLG
jgi:hypothetical protein